MSLVIQVPEHKAISWNKIYSQGHWTTRKKLADQIHEYIWAYAPNVDKISGKVDISITAHYKHKRRHDSDNVASKLYIDGLVKAGILEDDDTRYIGKVTTEAIIGAKEDKVIINILTDLYSI